MKLLIPLALAFAGATLLAVPAPAQAAGCVNRTEYHAVKSGWSMAHVHRTFGTRGVQITGHSSGGYSSEVRSYRGCSSPASVVSVAYHKKPGGVFRLTGKSAVFR